MRGERRAQAKDEARRILAAARASHHVKFDEVAAALEVSVSLVDAIFVFDPKRDRHLKYADLYLLATCPETEAMARDLISPLNAIFDRARLTLQEVDDMSRSPMTIDLARVLLRPTLERLFPVEMRSTLEVKP